MKKSGFFSKFYLILVFIFLFAPIAILVLFSFNDGESTAVFKGFSLQWYKSLFGDTEILNALKNTLILAVCSSAAATVMGKQRLTESPK